MPVKSPSLLFYTDNLSLCLVKHIVLPKLCYTITCVVSSRQIGVAYITATSTALATAVGLNLYTKVLMLLLSGSRFES